MRKGEEYTFWNQRWVNEMLWWRVAGTLERGASSVEMGSSFDGGVSIKEEDATSGRCEG